jgi:hypothetical protein
VNEFAYKIIVLSCEVERLMGGGAGSVGMKSREYEELKENYSRLKSKVTAKNNEIDILLSRIGSLEGKYMRVYLGWLDWRRSLRGCCRK